MTDTVLSVRDEWSLDPAVAYLNHGGYGVAPRAVLAAQQEWRERIERNPTRFLSREIDAAQRAAAREVAAAVGARGEDLVFVANATSGINAVLRAAHLKPGDELLIASLAYPAVRKAARFIAEETGARLVEAEIALPVRDGGALRAAFAARLSERTRLVIVDHIASASALLLPVAQLVADAQSAGARVLVDGAHAPGQVALDIPALGADWYVGNLHKWYFAPRSCGFLWAREEARAALHPLEISHGLGQGWIAEFDWTGTRDFTAALAAPAGITFHNTLGGARLMAANARLAREVSSRLAQAWHTECAGPPSMFAAMVSLRLPTTGAVSAERALRVVRWLAEVHRIEAGVWEVGGALWVRIAAQTYNEPEDYERLLRAVAGGLPA